jgi:microcystin-dependent protein
MPATLTGNIKGPQGDKGDKGDTGPQGLDGSLVGTVALWINDIIPPGWLGCDGVQLLIADYPDLYEVIGTRFGGDGIDNFNLPDLRGRVAVGFGQGIGLTNRTIGMKGGEERHTLTVSELAAHNHTATASQGTHTHSDSGHQHYCSGVDHTHWCSGVDHLHGDDHYHGIGGGQFNHSHTYAWLGGGSGFGGNGYGVITSNTGASTLPGGSTNWKSQQGYGAQTGACDRSMNFYSGAADRGLAQWTDIRYAAISTVSAGAITVSVANIGGNASHENMSPFLVLNYIIKALLGDLVNGTPGPAGPAATTNVGVTTTLPAGSQATVTNVGTESDAILDFGIPEGDQGVKGDKGDQGDKGDTGDRGESGSEDVGSIKAWPSVSPPVSWMLADGVEISRVVFPDLFSLIGVTYGAGDGSTTFNLPDLRSRFVIGAGQGVGLTDRVLGVTGGEENHILSVVEMPVHSHAQNAHTHTQNAHDHSTGLQWYSSVQAGAGVNVPSIPISTYEMRVGQTTATNQNTTATNQNTGSSAAHNNVPPFLVLTYIIKVSPTGSTAQSPIADTTQDGLLRKVSGLTTDFVDGTNNCQDLETAVKPVIDSVRLRSYNSIGNPTMEVDQRNVGGIRSTSGSYALDRWSWGMVGTMGIDSQQITANVPIPGTNFLITSKILRFTLTANQTASAASDDLSVWQGIEGPRLRELINDVHSTSLLVRSSVDNLKFGFHLESIDTGTGWYGLPKLCTLGLANTWNLIKLPNLPIWPNEGNFNLAPGVLGYWLGLILAAGSDRIAQANDVWAPGAYAPIGMDNFANNPVGSTFDIAFVQHQPGSICTVPIDCPFEENYDNCLRYFHKSADYGQPPGASGGGDLFAPVYYYWANTIRGAFKFPKPMAKIPAVTIYYAGVINNAFVQGTVNPASAGQGVTTMGFNTITVNTQTIPGNGAIPAIFDYVADTGW